MPALAAHQISLRLYPHPGSASEMLEGLARQARLAEAAGFDGLMTSEHHGGFPGYLPNPLQVAGFLLEETERVWAAPCPLLLPLQHWSHVAEQLAWLAARFPGRVGAGFALGGLELDFTLADLDYAQRRARFDEALPRLAAALRGEAEGPLGQDPALAACRDAPIPIVAAAQGPKAVDRAAGVGAGVLFDSMQVLERMRELSDRHLGQRPDAPRIAIRRIWLGDPPQEAVDAQMAFYRSYAPKSAMAHWGDDEELVTGETPEKLAEALLRVAREGGANAFNLRVHLKDVSPEDAERQIDRIGREVLPAVREGLKAL